MSAQHTPGPWYWVDSETDEPFDFAAQWSGHGCPSLRTVAKSIALGSCVHRPLPEWILDAEPLHHGNDEANARLIASAPDLLEMLERVVMLFDMHDDCKNLRETVDMRNAARSLISNAKSQP